MTVNSGEISAIQEYSQDDMKEDITWMEGQ